MAASATLETMLNANVILSIGLFAVFVAWNPNPPNTTGNGTVMAARFAAYGVVSFSCFMLSTFIVLFLKLAINRINVSTLYFWMFLAAFAQVNAFFFLILVVPIGLIIKFGSSSSSFHILAASLPIYILLPIALLYYISLLRYSLRSTH